MSIRNEQAENNLQSVGNVLSRWRRQASEIDTPIKHQHQRLSNTSKAQGNSDYSTQVIIILIIINIENKDIMKSILLLCFNSSIVVIKKVFCVQHSLPE